VDPSFLSRAEGFFKGTMLKAQFSAFNEWFSDQFQAKDKIHGIYF
jgi:hypothetical protein